MKLPFTHEQFFEVFRLYNEAVWPAQFLLFGLAAGVALLPLGRWKISDIGISAFLAFLWAWLAVAYHLAFFSGINPLAPVFSAISFFGALLFLWQGVVRRHLRFAWQGTTVNWAGAATIFYALFLYPLWSVYVGQAYPHMPTFGLPCPTTLYSIGMLALLVRPYPRSPLLVPILWSLVGVQAAFLLAVYQDLGLIAGTVLAAVLWMRAGYSPGARQ